MMAMTRQTFASAVALMAAMAGIASRGAAQQIPDDATIRAILEQRIAEGRAVGLVVGVLEADGRTRIIHAGSAGQAAQPLGEGTLFEIGSITKAFTGALLAEMARRGEVAIDAPVARYLPDDARVPSRGRDITLLDLATHRSGLPRLPSNLAPADGGNPYADYTVEKLYAFLSSHELQRDVGAIAEYSNLGTGLLGHALARAAGTSYEEALRTRILEPLGLRSTAITLNDELRSRMAQGHDPTLAPVPLWDIPALAGAGALRADIRDMLTWLAANVREPASDLERALRSAHEPRMPFGPDGASTSIGLNWIVETGGGHRIVWHNGGTGGFFSWAGFDPDRRIGLVVLSNAAHPVDDVALHLLDRSNPLSEPPRQRAEVRVAPAILRDYVGEYQLAPNFSIVVTFDNDALFIQATGQPRFPVFAETETDFFLRVVDAQLTFRRDASGAVTGLVLHQGGRSMPAPKVR
jgi:serine-type D-Ala-D-Ala carboxypeptidase/endopeptidase